MAALHFSSLGSFDHRRKYGLPALPEAIAEVQKELQHKSVIEAQLKT
jgi:hypothetical protein